MFYTGSCCLSAKFTASIMEKSNNLMEVFIMMYLFMVFIIVEIVLIFGIKVIDLFNEAEDEGYDLFDLIKKDIMEDLSWD